MTDGPVYLALQVKFIKFFAWEERWIDRTLDAREHEMKWMIKGFGVLLFLRDVGAEFVVLFSSPCQFGDVLHPVDVCPHLGVYYLVLCVCDAGEGIDCQCCVYGKVYPYLIHVHLLTLVCSRLHFSI
jgi:hypothetical protein